METDGRKWSVDGQVLAIPRFDPVIDKISGYGIPLKVSDSLNAPSWMLDDPIEQVSQIQNVTINMMDYDLKKSASLEIGQMMRVACKGVRSFDQTLVFDECRNRSGSKK